jgi:hypothetical protein
MPALKECCARKFVDRWVTPYRLTHPTPYFIKCCLNQSTAGSANASCFGASYASKCRPGTTISFFGSLARSNAFFSSAVGVMMSSLR